MYCNVRNRNRPEGCIAKCYIVEEAIEFCTEYYSNISAIGNPCEKNDHIQVGKPLSGGQHVAVDQRELVQAHLLVSMDDEIALTIEKDINGLTLREGKIVVEINDEGVPYGVGNLREKNSKRRKSYKYNHRLSRGGYVGMMERLGEPCKLIIQQLGNVVAMGTIIEILSACILVSVDVVLDEEELLPIPHDVEGLVFLRDALGHQILWPKELIDHESIMVVPKNHKTPKSYEPSKYAEDIKNFSNLVDNFLASGVGSVFVPFEVDVFRGTYYGCIY
ncbi:hypothetical protein LWI29_004212 [Acer saccharum]|uniref:DUF4218 domain-containing protein n=1 Tax=Acer saccharum TaxID=4024 RepID=A0AA39S1B0_ACESA|nr:hypothetical protein LWI29_004212 [Acer saccharum]